MILGDCIQYFLLFNVIKAQNQILDVMTELAQRRLRLSETPMAPYAGLMLSMEPDDMLIVTEFLQEAYREAKKAKAESKPTAAEIIREKFKNLKISQETKDLIRDLTLPREAMEDERTRYILGYK